MKDEIIIAGHVFDTLVAVTAEEHAKGLMYQSKPHPNMIFPYSTASIRKFWMQNTPSPLDIIFCRGNRIVDICYGEPFSTRLIGPNEPTDLVIELPYGTARSYNLRPGDEVSARFSPESKVKLKKNCQTVA